jgi:hypothetical protein
MINDKNYLLYLCIEVKRGGVSIMKFDYQEDFRKRDAERLKQEQERAKKRRAFYEKITSSREEALKSLIESGIYDETGHLAKEYR